MRSKRDWRHSGRYRRGAAPRCLIAGAEKASAQARIIRRTSPISAPPTELCDPGSFDSGNTDALSGHSLRRMCATTIFLAGIRMRYLPTAPFAARLRLGSCTPENSMPSRATHHEYPVPSPPLAEEYDRVLSSTQSSETIAAPAHLPFCSISCPNRATTRSVMLKMCLDSAAISPSLTITTPPEGKLRQLSCALLGRFNPIFAISSFCRVIRPWVVIPHPDSLPAANLNRFRRFRDTYHRSSILLQRIVMLRQSRY